MTFQVDESKFQRWNPTKRIIEFKLDYIEKYPDQITQIVNAFAITERDKKNKEVYLRFLQKSSHLEKLTLEYILRKTEKIGRTYNYKGINKKEFTLGRPRLLTTLLKELSEDYSHVTFKIRQAINFLRYHPNLKYSSLSSPMQIDSLSYDLQQFVTHLKDRKMRDRIADSKIKEKKGEDRYIEDFLIDVEYFNLINFLPPSFLSFDIHFETEGSYLQLSSGERQKVYTVSSVIYHLVNLNSVEKNKIKYDYINLIFDEIELYFHPEFQRTFLSELLHYIQRSGINLSGLNILFITHSPFILSDIPKDNILFLEKKKDARYAEPTKIETNTFAANIHELLAGGFFMDHTKGAIATQKIEELVIFHNEVKISLDKKEKLSFLKIDYKEKQKYFSRMVSCIGEEYLREILENQILDIEKMLDIESPDKLNHEILLLKQKIDFLEQRKKMLK
ncbi:AAA family ATPase [Flavobacterium qiangtangense]|uniref:AAA family ATPase n=1 Tax=Flavobacterium qiangtangense TaxID=1442595 RepID=A0ABW1PKG0_9FLAO